MFDQLKMRIKAFEDQEFESVFSVQGRISWDEKESITFLFNVYKAYTYLNTFDTGLNKSILSQITP